MTKIIIFLILSVPLVLISRRSLTNFKSHGFYRFFAWECILLLIVLNIIYWFQPLDIIQLIAWFMLFWSLVFVITGIIDMKKFGALDSDRKDKELYHFEKTTHLVESGIFHYIRHPLYSSLIFLAWGTFGKNITLITFLLALSSTVFLYITAIMDEKECISYYGDNYRSYIKRSKMFIPFIL